MAPNLVSVTLRNGKKEGGRVSVTLRYIGGCGEGQKVAKAA